MKHARIRVLCGLLSTLITSAVWASNTTHDVVIVGVGSAGLYAAKTLIEDGYDVFIIEATGRIGGRVYSHTLGTTRIELGAEEHYGRKGNNPVESATVTGLFTGDATGPGGSQDTNASGTVVFNSNNSKKGRVKFTFCVTDVELESLDYVPGNNAVDCASN